MGKFNKPAKVETELKSEPSRTLNYEGAEAFKLTPKLELYERVLTCLMEPKFYDPDGNDTVNAIRSLVEKMEEIDPEFVLKLAAYARNEMYLRSVPIFLLVLACKYPKMKSFIRKYTPHILRRADELTEVVALYIKENQTIGNKATTGMLSNPLKRGIADSFHNFSEYQFAKYNRPGEVKLKDVLRITHPKPSMPGESELFKRILDDNLAIPETWETYISVHGSNKENWDHIIPKMPIMATLRNLRNFVKVGANLDPVVEKLRNKEIIERSKQFPFRFLSAYKSLQQIVQPEEFNIWSIRTPRLKAITPKNPADVPLLMDAVQDAMELSVANVPRLEGTTFLTADNSGSMSSLLSRKGSIQYREVADLLQSIAFKFCDKAFTSVFGESFAIVNVSKHSSILDNMQRFFKKDVGHATNGWLAFAEILDRGISVDRILMFSDMQLWSTQERYGWDYGSRRYETVATLFRKYKSKVNPDAILYSFDLAGYGTTKTPENERNTVLVSGWSEKVLNFIPMYESRGKKAIEAVESYQIK